MPEVPFLFVVGAGRSGTTLLRSMLDAHPSVAVPGESHFIATMLRLRRRYERASGFDTGRFTNDLVGHERFQRWTSEPERLVAAVHAADPVDLAGAIRSVYAAYAAMHGASRYVDKTPDYVTRMDALARLFPEARFVHLIRDGREVSASLLAQPWGPDNPIVAARHWAERVNAGRASAARLGSDRVQEMRFERLVDDPEAALRSLCAFAELDFDPAMLDHRPAARRALEQVAAPDSHTTLLAPVGAAKSGEAWALLDERTRATIERAAARELSELGYAHGEVGRLAATGMQLRHRAATVRSVPRRLAALREFVSERREPNPAT